MAIPPLKQLIITDWFYTDDWFRVPFVGIVVCGLVFEAWVTSGFSNYDRTGRIEPTSIAPRIGNALSALLKYALCGMFCGFIGRLMHNSSRRSEFIRKQCQNPKKFGKWRMDQLHYDCEKYTCLLYTSPSPRDGLLSRMPSSA